MSLINKMLRDLEARHPKTTRADVASHADSVLMGDLEHTPSAVPLGKKRVSIAVTALVLLSVGASAGWYLAQSSPQKNALHLLPAQTNVTHVEQISSAPVHPEPIVQHVVESAQVTTGQPPKNETLLPQAALTHTSSIQKTVALAKGIKAVAPLFHDEAARGREILQPVPRQQVNATPAPAISTQKVNIRHISTPLEQRKRVLSLAQQHYAGGNYVTTISVLQQHLEQNSHAETEPGSVAAEITALDARIYRQLAVAQLRLNQTEAALNTLEYGHRHAPEDIELHMLYARMLLEQNLGERAYTMLRHIAQPQIEAQPDFYVLRAALARQQGFYTEAAELYALLCRLQPQRGDWRLGMAISQHQQGNLEQAYQNYQRAASSASLDAKLRDYASRQAQQLFSHE